MDNTDLDRLKAALTTTPENLCVRVCSHIAFNEHYYFPRFRENYNLMCAASHLARAYVNAYVHADGALDAVIERFADTDIALDPNATSARIDTALVTYIAGLASDQAMADLDLVVTDNDSWLRDRCIVGIEETPDKTIVDAFAKVTMAPTD